VIKATYLPVTAVHAIFEAVQGRSYALVLREERIDLTISELHHSLADGVEIIFIGLVPADEVEELKMHLNEVADISASVVPDWSDSDSFAFNITHKDATKEHAVAEVLQGLGVSKAEAIGIGDADNDLHLFRSVGLKIAMGNATPALKTAADCIAPPVDEDGLASIIEKYADLTH
jgi:hydroxymethylpyrimidine pyrophosphatase-like HAD family hydrolase